ncbi:MAG: SDR family oxidoreductase, partial [Pseudonocardiaceae bacterium]|nr:SDR family oxidoreductase [Pseudonocardiaceae bacterium]
VNAAGVVHPGSLVDAEADHIRHMVDVNLLAAIFLFREALPCLAQRRGAIISIGSVGGLVSSRISATYGATKAAIHHLTVCLAREFARHGVRINTIIPGPVETAFVGGGALQQLAEATLSGRIGQPDEIARWVTALADPNAQWVTGASLTVDGGFVIGP